MLSYGGIPIFSAYNQDSGMIDFSVHTPLIYEHLFYRYFYVSLTVRLQRQKCKNMEMRFSRILIKNLRLTFSVHISRIYEQKCKSIETYITLL